MSKKKGVSRRTRKANEQKPRRRHPRAVVNTSGAAPEEVAGQLNTLAVPFSVWYSATMGDDAAAEGADAEGVLDDVASVLALLEADVGPVRATALEPVQLRLLFEELLPQRHGNDTVELSILAISVQIFVTFLDFTDRWTGRRSDLSACTAVLDTLVAQYKAAPDRGADLDLPDLPPQDEVDALLGLCVVQDVTALVTWVGAGRAVTRTGALRLVDVPSAAHLLGLEVRTRRPGRQAQDELELDLEEPQDPERAVVRSMWEVPELALPWVTAVRAGLLVVSATDAVRTDSAPLLVSGLAPERLPVLRRLVAAYLGARVMNIREAWGLLGAEIAAAVIAALVASLGEAPLSERELRGKAADRLTDMSADAAGLVVTRVLFELEKLRGVGLFGPGSRYDVQDGVKCSVALAVRELVGAKG